MSEITLGIRNKTLLDRRTINWYILGPKFSVHNRASPSDNDWLDLLRTDWFENLPDRLTLKQIVKMTVQSEKSRYGLTGFKTYFEHCKLNLLLFFFDHRTLKFLKMKCNPSNKKTVALHCLYKIMEFCNCGKVGTMCSAFSTGACSFMDIKIVKNLS